MNSKNGTLAVAALQMVSGLNVDENMRRAEKLIKAAAESKAQLIALPEYFFLLGKTDKDKLSYAEEEGKGVLQDFLAQQAKQYGVVLIGGTIPIKVKNSTKVFNSTFVYSPQGTTISRYDKIHLFSFINNNESFSEAKTIQSGVKAPVVFEINGWKVGLGICYDLRFPELFRSMAGVDLIVLPSAFTYTTGQAHWEVLLRARAIENQCYILAPAQGGKHENGRTTWGHSMLIDPWGNILNVLLEGEGVVTGLLERDRITTVRQQLPALTHQVM